MNDIQEFVDRIKRFEGIFATFDSVPFTYSVFNLYPCDRCALPTWQYPCPFCGHFPLYPDEFMSKPFGLEGIVPYQHYKKVISDHGNYGSFYMNYQIMI